MLKLEALNGLVKEGTRKGTRGVQLRRWPLRHWTGLTPVDDLKLHRPTQISYRFCRVSAVSYRRHHSIWGRLFGHREAAFLGPCERNNTTITDEYLSSSQCQGTYY